MTNVRLLTIGKNRTITLRLSINYILFFLYIVNTIFVPYDNFSLKKLSFALLIILNLNKIISRSTYGKEKNIVILFALVLPIYTIIKSVVLTGDIRGNILSGYTGMILLLYFVEKVERKNIVKMMADVLVLLAILVDISALLDIVGILPVFRNPILMWMYSTENANIGKGPGYLLGYYIFIKTTPMLLLALGYMAERKRYLICTMILVALVLSGTRANAALGVLVFGLSLILAEKNNTKKALIIIVVIILGFYIFIGQEMFLKYMTYSASKIGSDLVRAGTLESILDSWKKSPFSLFFGQGYTSTFYNMGRMEWNSDVELAYWNLLRRGALGCFILMMIGYLYPIRWMIKTKKNIVLAFAYLMYLVGAYINPLLYTSTGVTVLLFMYCVAFIEYDEKLESSSVEV